jgi:uncharacterized membrane protein
VKIDKFAAMEKTRLEAFSDGVLAIIITIMVLELKVPHSSDWEVLREMLPVFSGYILSFIFVGIYWVNHHHLLHLARHVNSVIMWANLNLLFWLSLIPFATGWMGENHFSTNTVVVYAVLLELCGVAFTLVQWSITRSHHIDGALQLAVKRLTRKGLVSMVAYSIAIAAAFYNTNISCLLFVFVAIMWLVPERSIESALNNK